MLKSASILCAALFLTGCYYTVTDASHEIGLQGDKKVIVGIGHGSVQEAHREAWEDARAKLEISGLEKYYGLVEESSQYNKAHVAVIVFKLIPLKDFESTEHDGDVDGEI